MLDAIGQKLGGLIGLRRSNLAVPILDGVFKPNNLLEEAGIVAERAGLEDMALAPDGRVLVACGHEVLALGADGALSPVSEHASPVTALAVLPDGRVAVALGDRIEIDGAQVLTEAGGAPFHAITSLSVGRDGALLICDGSARRGVGEWQFDLMEKGASGRLVSFPPGGGAATVLQSGLCWAYGAWQGGDGGILVSESWRHRLRRIGKGDLGEMPGYPARITPTEDGGFWLAIFAARMQIVEFVLNETDFRREMMATIAPEHWISPAYSSGRDFLEPLQGGGVKQMGILKPWAPPRSYGLAVRFSAAREPLMSMHSRVGGENHGVVTVLERGDEVLALSKGAGRILRLEAGAIRRANAIGGDDA